MSAPRHGRSSWWRRQRLALALLPIMLVTALVASSSNVKDLWWDRGFHDAAPVAADGSVTIEDTYDDGFLRYPIRATIALEGARRVTELPDAFGPLQLPDGSALWEVRLAWRADPGVSLIGCQIALMDRDGSQYTSGTSFIDAGAATPIQQCVPDETPGPRTEFGSTEAPRVPAGEGQRPERYSTLAYVLTPEDATPESVRVWWILPSYAELPLI